MRLFYLLPLIFGLYSCSKSTPSFTEVQIEEVFADSLQTIRDLQAKNAENIWFSAGEGRVGVLQNGIPKMASVRYNETILKFKSITVQDSVVYLLHPTRPVLVYKLDYDHEGAKNLESVYIQEAEEVFYNVMAFWDAEKGILVGERENSDCLAMTRTLDGGKTWEEISCEALPPLEEGELLFASSNSNISVHGSHIWVATGGTKARVFHSADYGENWEVYTTPIIQGEEGSGIFSIDFFDANHGVIIGGKWKDKTFNKGNKAYTKDGGKTWKLFGNAAYPGLQKQVVFVPNSVGKSMLSIGENGIAYSNNVKDWEKLSDKNLDKISFVNDSTAYASEKGILYRLVFR
ncbi:MAG TPA: hypothetical protein VKX30_06305 [Flavobacteriaceae bacterium]|nr:hypothetical protein [Flavobacteriaceae bacterium]